VTLEPATAADRPVIEQLFREHLRALGYAPDPELDRDVDTFPELYCGPGDAFVIGRDEVGRAIAMGGVRGGEVVRIYVRPEHRGRGVARRVVERLLEIGRPASGMFRAIVAQSNTPALALFEAAGFVRTGRAPQHPKMGHCEVLEREVKQR
jgi:ribosomal protein S18 acetylase RimI-like enzyme